MALSGKFLIQSFLVALIALSTEAHSPFTCDPPVDCISRVPGEKVPDPHSCTNYFLCVYNAGNVIPTDDPIACPNGNYFDHKTGDCENENGIPCQDVCLNMCTTSCQVYQQLVPFLGDCTKYYICLSEQILVQCPTGLYFNGKECTTVFDDCCDNCTPYCDEPYQQVRDPFYCESYYVCQSEGIPSVGDRHSCAQGSYFDASLKVCTPYLNAGDVCKPLCTT